MGLRNTSTNYGSVTKFFHWLIFLLVTAMIIFGYFLEDIPKPYQSLAYNTHKLTGVTIFFLMILRALWALLNPKPFLPPDTLPWQRWAEHAVHYLLYIVILAMPLVGWIGASAAGKGPQVGSGRLNLPIAKNENVVDVSFQIHNTLAVVIIVLVSLHILAALYHHFFKHDNTLVRMLPHTREQ